MKKLFLLLAAGALLMMPGCKKDPVEIAVTSVSINVPSITLTEGESQMLRATVLPSDAPPVG